MSSPNTIEEAWRSYQTTVECLAIVARMARGNDVHALQRTSFFGAHIDEASDRISASASNADDYVILSMWALFERHLFLFLQDESKRMLNQGASRLTKELQIKIEDELEYWRLDGVLDLFKSIVDPQLIGEAKQVKQYRDFIAHRNPKKPPRTNVSPQAAYQVLSNIINRLESH
jgi:hypothetical protein